MRLLQDLVSAQAQIRPDATAVVMGSESVTYGRLEERSNRLANLLRECDCRPGNRVALFLPKSPNAIVGMLGTLKAGCIYVPIDVKSPAPRLVKILSACEPGAILLSAQAAKLYREVLATWQPERAPQVILMDANPQEDSVEHPVHHFDTRDIARCSPDRPAIALAEPDPAAHILFTSGSTGVPKGVVILHRNVLGFVDWATRYFDIQPGDRNSGHAPLYFDLSTFDIYGTLAAGAQLHMVPPEWNLLPQKLAEFMRTSGLTQWFSVPSALTYMAKFDVVKQGDLPALRRILWCGDVLPTPTLIYWMERLPGVTFTNLYGPTEATIASSYYTMPRCPADEREAIPIGKGCGGEQLFVLDSELRPVPCGEVGDLYIQGIGLSPGYWRDPAKTAEAFLRNPFDPSGTDRIYRTGDLAKVGDDGNVYFLGRADTQIKSRGHRIELGEIETAVNAMNSVRECGVVAVQAGGFEGMLICCAFVPADSSQLTVPQLRTALTRVLPGYMIPARWKTYVELPKNANGKIDRRRLKEEFLEDVSQTPAAH